MAFGGFRFARLELKRFFTGGSAKALVAALVVVPCLCAVFCLASYSNSLDSFDAVPVAVVNQDEGATINGEERNVGEEVCDDISVRSDGLQWNFVSADEAQAGMESGKYYMVCTIPADFSEKIASAETGDPETAKLSIEYDESKNALASEIGRSVWRDVQGEISDSVSRQYWSAVLTDTSDAGRSMEESAASAQQLADGMDAMKEGNSGIAQGVSGIAEGASALEGGLVALAEGGSALGQAASALSDGGPALVAGAKGIAEGTSALGGQISALGDQAGALALGAQAVDKGLAIAVQGIGAAEDASSGNPTLAAASQSVTDGLENLSASVKSLRETTATPLKDKLSTLKSEVDGVSSDLHALASESSSAEGVQESASAMESAKTGADAIVSDADGIRTCLAVAGDETASAHKDVNAAIGAISELLEDETLDGGDRAALESVLSDLGRASDSLSTSEGSLAEGSESIESVSSNAASVSSAVASLSSVSAAGISDQIESAALRLDEASSSMIGEADDEPASSVLLDEMSSNAGASPADVPNAQETRSESTLFATANALDEGLDGMIASIGAADAPGMTLAFASNGVTQGIGALGEGLALAQTSSSALSAGASAFAYATPLMAQGVEQLGQGAYGIAAGVEGYVGGASVLAQSIPAFAQGISGVAQGAGALASGGDALASASSQMGEGLGMMAEMGQSLSDDLEEGSDGLVMPQSEIEDKSQMMSSPIDLDESYYTYAESYGSSLTPYLLAMGLWIGCLAAGCAIRPFDRRLLTLGGNPVFVAFFGFVPLALVGLIQAVALVFAMQFALGLQAANAAQLYAFAALAALSFAALSQALSSFGFVGRLLGVVWLALQAACVPGVFPVETVGPAFQALGSFMPMTYVAEGARQLVFGTGFGSVLSSAAALVFFAAIGLCVTSLVAWRKRLVRMGELHPSSFPARP